MTKIRLWSISTALRSPERIRAFLLGYNIKPLVATSFYYKPFFNRKIS